MISMTRGESLSGAARHSVPMKPQVEPLEPEVTSELTGAGFTPVIAGHVLNITTRHKFELINLTQQVEELVGKTGIRGGFALLQSLHSTAALFVNEWQEALLEDFRTLLEQAVRADSAWRHNDPSYSDCDRSNAASHLRALLLGSSAVLAIRRGQLVRGKWQSIILAELDGPRTRSVSLQILGA
jgi:secondary thiamine-phosphate synthase enzyme